MRRVMMAHGAVLQGDDVYERLAQTLGRPQSRPA
jgi:hypothetical protein